MEGLGMELSQCSAAAGGASTVTVAAAVIRAATTQDIKAPTDLNQRQPTHRRQLSQTSTTKSTTPTTKSTTPTTKSTTPTTPTPHTNGAMAPRNADPLDLPPPESAPLFTPAAAATGHNGPGVGLAAAITAQTHGQKSLPLQIVWKNVGYYVVLHIGAIYGLYLLPFCHPLTWLWTLFVYLVGSLGITAGAHRLWAHRSYKAKLPARILLVIFNLVAFQNDIIEWSRDHRVHHKYSETDADPHNAKRGFFFAHIGWLLCRKHPDVKSKGKDLNYDDLYRDPVLVLQRKFYLPLVLLFCFFLPTWIPAHYWGESAWNAYFTAGLFRYVVSLNVTWLVNSAAHMWGNKPYDRNINPAENFFVTFGAVGEGFHNYHHTFPNDYSTSEYGWRLNLTTLFIDALAKLGWVYDRKKMSHEAIFRRRQRTGDSSYGFSGFTWFGFLSSKNTSSAKNSTENESQIKEHSN